MLVTLAGIAMLVIWLFSNAYEPMQSTPFSKETVFKANVWAMNDLPIDRTFFGIVRLVSEDPSNAWSPIETTLSGIEIFVIPLKENNQELIAVKLLGKVTLRRLVQEEKAFDPIDLTVFGMTMLCKRLPEKAPLPMLSTLLGMSMDVSQDKAKALFPILFT